jgi:hypothetical protein
MPERLLLLALFATERHILQKKFSQTALVAVVTTAGCYDEEREKRKEESDYSYHSITLYLRYSFLIHILSLNLQRSFSI